MNIKADTIYCIELNSKEYYHLLVISELAIIELNRKANEIENERFDKNCFLEIISEIKKHS